MVNKKRTYTDLQDFLKVELQNPKLAAAYLKAAFEDEDERVFLLAVRDVLEARGESIACFAQENNLSKSSLYRIFSQKTKPSMSKLISILHGIGFEVAFHPITQK